MKISGFSCFSLQMSRDAIILNLFYHKKKKQYLIYQILGPDSKDLKPQLMIVNVGITNSLVNLGYSRTIGNIRRQSVTNDDNR